jgi:hypothetical protein
MMIMIASDSDRDNYITMIVTLVALTVDLMVASMAHQSVGCLAV